MTQALTPVTKSRKKKKDPLVFTAVCAGGLEELLTGEVLANKGEAVTPGPGFVTWSGTMESAYRMCLWSRFASKIFLKLASFQVDSTDTLYKEAMKIDWRNHFGADNTMAVSCTLTKTHLTHSQYAALRIKDAIVDQFRQNSRNRPDIDTKQPDIGINLHVHQDLATLSLDLSGESLHRRGYRSRTGEAPLKETLAAGLVTMSGWNIHTPPDFTLLDPMCGAGTLLIEAAMIFGDNAPGLYREQFGFSNWRQHSPNLWQLLLDEALERENAALDKDWPQLIGYDADTRAVSAARKNIKFAGYAERISIKNQQLAGLRCPSGKGTILVNPPYGERLEEKEEVKYLYRCLGRKFHSEFGGWQLALFTSNPDLAHMAHPRWRETFKLFNGPIKCKLFLGDSSAAALPPPIEGPRIHETESITEGTDFANRLRKNCQHLFKWAEQNQISCFRIYDGDIPEYNIAVDIYEEWIHVQEYAPPANIDPQKSKDRLSTALNIIRELTGTPHSRVFIKTRKKQKGESQYQKFSKQAKLYEVREQGLRFLVNFTDYLDTGLFLDHRITRDLLRGQAKEKKFLNLFAYTGSATVYACDGGARETTSVDVSANYLSRAKANLALNGFGGPYHETVQADCLEWLAQTDKTYDLIFVDPPTFSNSKQRQTIFDVQLDHSRLLQLAMNRLRPGGLLIFSTNFKKFKLDDELDRLFSIREITEQTIPEDFSRKKIHRSFEFRHPE
ncbi:MAG: bifunctional 23S rRNA (guanine(2069)-N(7))-methyltransferase RlmK/23S rRNA (guanine(2445)-N(2))-methyltransferase RlmL [Desulfobulbaceae bacterium]|nr:bifunctional 23S rRNA (guanine(2069)-N(7))-methyltransferase RlmK/23S rRNA (guanine(2445)-N(2))-methyltransferase RlmL [Desulfobulbaceae bacterium]